MQLSGTQLRMISEALLDALSSRDELDAVVSFSLDRPLSRIVAEGKTIDAAILAVIRWAKTRDKIGPLLVAARDLNPDNTRLRAAVEAVALDEGAGSFEKAVFSNIEIADPDDWRNSMVMAERAVCRVDTPSGVGVGTACLIAKDIAVTNYHVIDAIEKEGFNKKKSQLRFDYRRDGTSDYVLPGVIYALHHEEPFVAQSELLDFSVLRLDRAAGEEPVAQTANRSKRGWLRPVAHDFVAGEPICIIQHPNAGYRKFAYGSVHDPAIGANHIGYKVNTEPGSSGSPCFTHDWRLVALHHSGRQSESFNRGIKWSSILGALRPETRAELARTSGGPA